MLELCIHERTKQKDHKSINQVKDFLFGHLNKV